MSKMIQIRNVPDSLHRTLKARAAAEGKALSDYLLEEIQRIAALPTPRELWERIAKRERVVLTESAADAVRAIREERDAKW